jgi:putative methyltransferase (TIGR04325 family)
LLQQVETTIKKLPGVRKLLEMRYEQSFVADGLGWFRGVYGSFGEANASAPAGKPLGFDNQAYAKEFEGRLTRVFSFDYPILLWLSRILQPNMRIFDFGGHRGTHFYSYAQYLSYPEGFQWMVYDLPEIVAAGKELAAERDAHNLSFTTSLADAKGADIFLAAGSLQYVESPSLPEMLAGLGDLPQYLLLNKLPLYNGKRYVTLQNGGAAFHPAHVFNRQEFIEPLIRLGYSLVDQWDVPSRSGRIPFHPEASFHSHSGLYFVRS